MVMNRRILFEKLDRIHIRRVKRFCFSFSSWTPLGSDYNIIILLREMSATSHYVYPKSSEEETPYGLKVEINW